MHKCPESVVLWLMVLFVISFSNADDYRRFNEFNMQPEVWHFLNPVEGEVNAKGDLSLSIPVLTVPGSNDLDFQVSFSYKSGILFHQTASWIGLGWNFDPGSITRDVQGNMIINDSYGSPHTYGVDNNDESSFTYLPDDYYLSLPEKGTFTLYRTNLPQFNEFGISPFLHPFNGDHGFYPEQYKPYKITALTDATYDYPGNYFVEEDITGFEVVTDDGYRYYFGLPSLAIYISYTGGNPYQYHPNVWRLLAIAGPDFAGDINSLLQGDDYQISNLGPTHAYNQLGNYTDWIKLEYGFDDTSIFCDQHAGPSHLLQHSYLRWVITPTHYARFYTDSRNDIDLREDPNYSTQAFYKKLTKIELYTRDYQLVQSVELTHDYLLGQQYHYNPVQGDNNGKLTLKNITTKSYNGQALPGYSFEYVDYNPEWDFRPDVFYYDGYGYYNEAETPRIGIDRVTSDAKAWSLKSIIYPTGGSESYYYDNDEINDTQLKYIFKSKIEPAQIVWFNFNNWAGSYSCRRQGGTRVTKIVRKNGMGDSLQITYSYGPGHVPSVPPQLLPWINLDMLIAKNEFHVYKRGDLDVVYEWVKKSYNTANYEMTYYQISQDYYRTYPDYSQMNTVFYESPLNQHWIFHTDNQNLFWGIPWDWPIKKIISKNNQLEVSEYQYQSTNRKVNIMVPASVFGTLFSSLQITPVLTLEKNMASAQNSLPLLWPYQQTTIERMYDDTTKQLKTITTKTHDKLKKQKIIYAHEIPDYGGTGWNPATLKGLRRENSLNYQAQTIDYYSDLLKEPGQQNCPAQEGDSLKVWVYALAFKENDDEDFKEFFVPFPQNVRWKCQLAVGYYGMTGQGQASFKITEDNTIIVQKNLSGNVPPDHQSNYSGIFMAYPGHSYRIIVTAEANFSKTSAEGEVKYITQPPLYLSIPSAQTTTYSKVPCWVGTGNLSIDSTWKVKQVYLLCSDEPLCELPPFISWNGLTPPDPLWKKKFEVVKYRYGKPILYEDGNGNQLKLFYGDNSNNMDTTFASNYFGRDYLTAIQQNGYWSKQFDYHPRFRGVSQIKDENNNSIYFLYDNFGRLTGILNPDQDTTLTYKYTYSSQWSPSGTFNKDYPNYIRIRQFLNGSDKSDSFEFYDGRGQMIQQVVTDQTNDGFLDFYLAKDLDLMDREIKIYKNYQQPATGQPSFDKNYRLHSPAFTRQDYWDFFTRHMKEIVHPDQTHHLYTYNFISANEVLPDFFLSSDSVVWRFDQIIDENGNKIRNYLDEFGQKVLEERFVASNQSLKTFFKYDALGNLTEVYQPLYFSPPSGVNPVNCIIQYGYNTMGKLMRKSNRDEGESFFKYDNNGNLRFKRDANQDSLNSFIYYKYDALDRLLEEGVWTDGSAFTNPAYYENPFWPSNTASTWKVRNYYDVDYFGSGENYCVGKLTKSEVNSNSDTQPEISTRYRYNKMGQMIEKSVQIKGLEEKRIFFVYDRQGHLIQTNYPSGTIVQREYNKRNLLRKIRLAF